MKKPCHFQQYVALNTKHQVFLQSPSFSCRISDLTIFLHIEMAITKNRSQKRRHTHQLNTVIVIHTGIQHISQPQALFALVYTCSGGREEEAASLMPHAHLYPFCIACTPRCARGCSRHRITRRAHVWRKNYTCLYRTHTYSETIYTTDSVQKTFKLRF